VSRELRTRVSVAAVGIPIVLGVAYLGGWYLAVPLAAFAAWGAHELFRLSAKSDVRAIEQIGVVLSAGLVLLAAWRPDFAAFAPVALAGLGVGAVASLLEAVRARGPQGHPLGAAAVTVFGAVYVGLALSFVPLLHALPRVRGWTDAEGGAWAGLIAVALPLAATWVGDASAYFAGSAWGRGRGRLAPTISPNKSWVGFWAALVGAAGAALLWAFVARLRLPGLSLESLLAVGIAGAALGLAAVLGDLVESLLKREAGVKDSGTFFPGHGGVLDRVDSLLFTFPTAYLALMLLESSA
jgi:phosphatidate cytidylyltransferase